MCASKTIKSYSPLTLKIKVIKLDTYLYEKWLGRTRILTAIYYHIERKHKGKNRKKEKKRFFSEKHTICIREAFLLILINMLDLIIFKSYIVYFQTIEGL